VLTLALALAFLGPPKLPPLPNRNMPPEPPKAAPAETTPAVPSTPAAKPESAPAVPSAPAAKPPTAPAPTSPTIGPASAPQAETQMRVVDAGEVARWAEEDERRAAAIERAAKPEVKTPKAKTHDGPVLRTASEEPPPERLLYRRRPHPPERSAAFVIGYRHFRIHDALERAQDWHLASLEVAPLRRYVRLNLITEFGVEGGEAARAGDRADLMLLERVGLGMQYPHFVTPLVEFQAGVGGARVELFQRNDLAFLYTLGVDAGAQWAVTKWMYLHAVVGWIRPTFRWPDRTAAYDRFTFKVGVGF
jgi:hypothetical protein